MAMPKQDGKSHGPRAEKRTEAESVALSAEVVPDTSGVFVDGKLRSGADTLPLPVIEASAESLSGTATANSNQAAAIVPHEAARQAAAYDRELGWGDTAPPAVEDAELPTVSVLDSPASLQRSIPAPARETWVLRIWIALMLAIIACAGVVALRERGRGKGAPESPAVQAALPAATVPATSETPAASPSAPAIDAREQSPSVPPANVAAPLPTPAPAATNSAPAASSKPDAARVAEPPKAEPNGPSARVADPDEAAPSAHERRRAERAAAASNETAPSETHVTARESSTTEPPSEAKPGQLTMRAPPERGAAANGATAPAPSREPAAAALPGNPYGDEDEGASR